MKHASRFPARVARAATVLTAATLLLAACSGDNSTDATAPIAPSSTAESTPVAEASATVAATAPSATTVPAATATATPEPASTLDSLSLVYVDTRRGQGGDIFVAGADGSNPRLVVTDPALRRLLDVAGGTLAILEQSGLAFVDLEEGDKRVGIILPAEANVLSGVFFDDATFLYSQGSGCGPDPGGSRHRVDLPAGDTLELVADSGFSIVGVDVETDTVAVVPRGCDVGIAAIEVYDATTFTPRNSLAVEGCG